MEPHIKILKEIVSFNFYQIDPLSEQWLRSLNPNLIPILERYCSMGQYQLLVKNKYIYQLIYI